MVLSIPMNMGYNNNPYIVMPLNKTRDVFDFKDFLPARPVQYSRSISGISTL